MKVTGYSVLLFSAPAAAFVQPQNVAISRATKLNLSLKTDIFEPVKNFLSDLSKDISNFLVHDIDDMDLQTTTETPLFVEDAVLKIMPLVNLEELLPTVPSGSLLVCKEDGGAKIAHVAILLNIHGRVLVRTTMSVDGVDNKKPVLLDVADYVESFEGQQDKSFGFGIARVHHRQSPSQKIWDMVVDFDTQLPKTPVALGHWLRAQYRGISAKTKIDMPGSVLAMHMYEQMGWVSSASDALSTMDLYAPNLLSRGAYMEPTEFFKWDVKPGKVKEVASDDKIEGSKGKLMP